MAAPASSLRDIRAATFRANPAYELVLFDRLPAAEQAALADLQQDPDLYGLLRPRGPGLSLKSACRETALLFFTLQTPGTLPAYVTTRLGAAGNEAIARLVLDRILEMESAGTFRSGAEAHRLIYAEHPSAETGGVLARLSLEAVRYGQGLDLADATQLSTRLYAYQAALQARMAGAAAPLAMDSTRDPSRVHPTDAATEHPGCDPSRQPRL